MNTFRQRRRDDDMLVIPTRIKLVDGPSRYAHKVVKQIEEMGPKYVLYNQNPPKPPRARDTGA